MSVFINCKLFRHITHHSCKAFNEFLTFLRIHNIILNFLIISSKPSQIFFVIRIWKESNINYVICILWNSEFITK